jgi:hypothetical protein
MDKLVFRSDCIRSLKQGESIMKEHEDSGREEREAQAVKVKQKEGTGTVPNVTSAQGGGKEDELQVAAHELEEKKGDWSKDH